MRPTAPRPTPAPCRRLRSDYPRAQLGTGIPVSYMRRHGVDSNAVMSRCVSGPDPPAYPANGQAADSPLIEVADRGTLAAPTG